MKRTMYIVNLDQKMEFQALPNAGAAKVKVKYLVSKSAGARNFHLTYYSVEKGGHTPLDKHVNEHEVFVMKGRGRVIGTGEEHKLTSGDVIYIRSNETHQLVNDEDEPFEFLCIKGTDELYSSMNRCT